MSGTIKDTKTILLEDEHIQAIKAARSFDSVLLNELRTIGQMRLKGCLDYVDEREREFIRQFIEEAKAILAEREIDPRPPHQVAF